ncbi:gliding motility protein RemB [Pedobacter faecalis]|uniref:gliding motility protein RemB n=1 Tax=Pedobacter faecalis TaxID=3041495 RepID=UPI00254FD85B|nr:gliding motility protein RemB [Pedobacter sp. ELA7]
MKRILIVIPFLLSQALSSFAQEPATPNQIIPYNFQFYQKLNKQVYDTESRLHSSIKGFYADEPLLRARYEQLMKMGTDSMNQRSWLWRKLAEEHLIQVRDTDYTFYADFLADFQIGREFNESETVWKNTRGVQIGGTVGSKFSFYSNVFENQGVFANYLKDFINANQVVPSEMTGKFWGEVEDWSYATALLSFTPNKYLSLSLGYDKNFIGDGYRSLLLSDVAANYSFLRVRATLSNVQYQTILGYMLDPGAPLLTNDRRLGYRGKWAAIHYLDWNISNRLSFGFFQAVTWADAEPEGKRGFDFNYAHPFVFLRAVEGANAPSPDKMRLGFNAKYEVTPKTAVYGQFMFDEFTASEFFSNKGYWANKWAAQIGFRGSDLFNVENLNYLAEFNTVRPYTYAHFNRLSNYSAYNQPLAHPLGANFREVLGIMNYSYRRFDLQGQLMYARYGLDREGQNFGQDIFKSYETRSLDYGSRVGQGLKTNLYFAEVKASYLLNPKYNLRFELGGVYRRESTDVIGTQNTQLITFGLRSTFRNLYQDF